MNTSSWDTATWISILALVVSGLSFLAAIWASWISHSTLGHARKVHQEERRITFERERSQLLDVINARRLLLDKTRIEIGALKANFDAAPQPVRVLLKNYTTLFTEYLPKIELGMQQCDLQWSEVLAMEENVGIQKIVQHQAQLRAGINNDQIAHDQGLFLVGAFQEKMDRALEYVSRATR